MIGFSVLGCLLVANALTRLVALIAPRSWCARLWFPARPDLTPARVAYHRRMVLAGAVGYLWLGLWVALYVLAGPDFSRDHAGPWLILAIAVPLTAAVPMLITWLGWRRDGRR